MTNKLISLAIITLILSLGYSYSEEQFLFPKEKPSIFKKIEKSPNKTFSSNLPQKKPLTDQDKVQENEVSVKEKKEVKKFESIKNKSSFIFPEKKPSIYKSNTKSAEKSSILSQKDFDRAKETIQFIKDKKWNSALKSAAKVKDREINLLE